MIIGLSGIAGSGKDSTANIIINKYQNWSKVSFANAMKNSAACMFGLPRELLEGDTKESREWREQKLDYWSEKLGQDVTPRNILQILGTELVRKHLNENFWVDRLELEIKKLTESGKNVIITDVRFPNEAAMIKSLGGQIWHVFCGEIPQWFTDYRDKKIEPENIHESEWKWADVTPDVIIHPEIKGLDLLEKLVIEAYQKNINI